MSSAEQTPQAQVADGSPTHEATVQEAVQDALRQQSRPKSWLTRALATVMQLPNQIPLQVLRILTPEGPMPVIVNLPSRDAGRTIPIYVWIPPKEIEQDQRDEQEQARSAKSSSSSSRSKKQDESNASPASTSQIKQSFSGAQRPCLVDFHGGGFYMGGPLEEAPWCAALARSGIIAITVHYRQAPNADFPAALLDAEDVIHAVLDENKEAGKFLRDELQKHSDGRILEPDPLRVAVSGFSSGGNIALNTVLSIPAKLNTADAGLNSEEIAKFEDGKDQQFIDNAIYHDDKGDWPSPLAASKAKMIPTLLFFPSLDLRQAPFERKLPQGVAPPSEVGKFIGRAMLYSYLPKELVGHLRASPGLAPIGMRGGVEQEIRVRREAAKRHDIPVETSPDVLQRVVASASSSSSSSKAAREAALDCMHPATRAVLILPQLDSLSEQSEIWVEALDAAEKLITSPEDDGSLLGQPLRNQPKACVRVHRIRGMSHGFTTFPDAFIDEKTRAEKHLVMEQARQFVVNMWI